MKNTTVIGNFGLVICKNGPAKNTFKTDLYYKQQLLLSASVNVQVINFNSHLKEFFVKLVQRIVKAFIY